MSDYNPKQCAFAMEQLLLRLLAEGYVVDERQDELRERAHNLGAERGFLTNLELVERAAPVTPTETDETEELLS